MNSHTQDLHMQLLSFIDIPTLKDAVYGFDEVVINEEKQVEVIMKAASIAVIQLPAGRSKIVLFRPTAATMKAVSEYEGRDIELHVEDENGMFGPRNPQRIVSSVYEPGNRTMIVDMENQNG